MNESSSWASYRDTLFAILAPCEPVQLGRYKGTDLKAACAVALQSPPVSGVCEAYETAKLEKIGLCSFVTDARVQYGICVIVPKADYDLPLFVSRWEETERDIAMLVDLIPSVDALMHEHYREKYVDSMGDLWDKFSHLPGICPEENDAVRSVCSIIYTAARVPVENPGMRQAVFAPHSAYLKRYCGFVESAEAVSDEKIFHECGRRRTAIRSLLASMLQDNLDDVAGTEKASLLRAVLF